MTRKMPLSDKPATLQLNQFFPYRLSQLNASVSEVIAQLYSGRFDLTPHAWRVVATLGENEQLAATEIAQLTSLEKMQVSRAISSLKATGLIMQEVDRKDRRFSRLRLSDDGRKIYQQIVPLVTAREGYLLSVLSDEEKTLLYALIDRIANQAETLKKLG